MIESFLKYIQIEKRLSPHTVTAYQTDLLQLQAFLLSTFATGPTDADHHMLRSWIASLSESGNEPASINRKIACLRSFYKFLRTQAVIATNPMSRIHVLKTKKRLPGFIKETDMVNLLDNHHFQGTFEEHRDRLILELMYGTGIRRAELIALREESIDLKNRTLRVLGKRNKERVIPFPSSLVKLMENYLAARQREVVGKEHGIFFVRRNGEPCYPVMVYKIVKKYLSGLTSLEKRSPHVLRHTYATHLLDRGAELNAVKDLLGHASLAATQVYTHNSTEKLKKAFQQAHPKA